MKSSLFALSSLFVAVLATPTPTLNKRQSQTQCGSLGNNQYSTMTATPYELQSDLWGADSSGSQCWTLDSGSSSGISWSTSWTWGGGYVEHPDRGCVSLRSEVTERTCILTHPSQLRQRQVLHPRRLGLLPRAHLPHPFHPLDLDLDLHRQQQQ